jgi:hypothetical protein
MGSSFGILQSYGHDLLICSNGAKNPLKGKLTDDMKLQASIVPRKIHSPGKPMKRNTGNSSIFLEETLHIC